MNKQYRYKKNVLVYLTAAILLLVSQYGYAENANILNATKSVVRIVSQLSNHKFVSGTAFCINKNGYYLTNAHVVRRAKKVMALYSSDHYEVKVVKRFDNYDLSILKIPGLKLAPLPFADRDNIFVTDRVFTIGFPGAADAGMNPADLTKVTVNSGVIGKFTRIPLAVDGQSKTLRPVVQHDAAINHGNSGGPLLNECGEVVGVNVQKGIDAQGRTISQIAVGDVVQGIFYAIDIKLAEKALESAHVGFVSATSKCSSTSGTAATRYVSNSGNFRYLAIVLILVALLTVWSTLYYMHKKKNGVSWDRSELSRIVSEKLKKRNDLHPSFDGSQPGHARAVLKPMKGDLPILHVTAAEGLLGRSRSARYKIQNLKVSGKHLSLKMRHGQGIVVKDLGSTNGTFVNGKKLTPHRDYILKPNDILTIGTKDVTYTA